MRKFVMTTALGCLAMATAADAQIAGTAPSGCAYGAFDNDMVLEMARLDMRAWNPHYLA
jgi:hypothetical protein